MKDPRSRMAGNRTRYRNWLNRRARARGKVPLPDRIMRGFSSLPVYRSRLNPATGRPHRDDKPIGAVQDGAMARMRAADDLRAARAADNQRFVRDMLARRDPDYARVVDRAARDVASGTRPGGRAGMTEADVVRRDAAREWQSAQDRSTPRRLGNLYARARGRSR